MRVSDGVDAEGRPKFKEIDAMYAKTLIESKSVPPNEREADAKSNIELIQRKMGKSQVISKLRTIYVADNSSNLGSRIAMLMANIKIIQ